MSALESIPQPILQSLKELVASRQLTHLAELIDSQHEHKLDRFNIFDVLQISHRELQHSNFLAFLLNPNGKHGYGSAFAELFLTQICHLDPAQFDARNFIVRREWKYIDILLLDDKSKTLVIIENKIFSGEGEGQLETYWKIGETDFPDWTRVGIYLTPRGLTPSHQCYQAASYNDIAQLIDQLLAKPISGLLHEDALNVYTSIRQYAQMLRRHILEDQQVTELSKRIFHEHHATLRYLNEFYASWQKEMLGKIADFVKASVQSSNQVFNDKSAPNYIRFGLTSMRNILQLNADADKLQKPWTTSGHLLLFVVHNQPHSVRLELFYYWDTDELRSTTQATRDKLVGLASAPPFDTAVQLGSWLRIYSRELLPETDSGYLDCDEAKLLGHLQSGWNAFMTSDFPQIEKALQKLFPTNEP